VAFRFMIKIDPPTLIVCKLPLFWALAHDLGPEWLCGVLGHRFCNAWIFSLPDRAYDGCPQFEISLPNGMTVNQVKTFLGWPTWDDDD
jgi:hypothetical protein